MLDLICNGGEDQTDVCGKLVITITFISGFLRYQIMITGKSIRHKWVKILDQYARTYL